MLDGVQSAGLQIKVNRAYIKVMTDTDLIVVSVACGSDEEAQNLARQLVEHGVAACVQSHAIVSTYRWEGKVETSPEIMLTIKTRASKLSALESIVKSHHSYDVPEIIAVPVVWASEDYARWLRDSVRRE
jgi:periplasmic divalent cation tolerance protein